MLETLASKLFTKWTYNPRRSNIEHNIPYICGTRVVEVNKNMKSGGAAAALVFCEEIINISLKHTW